MPGITVKELRNALIDLPDDMLVIVQSDPEGNAYRYCYGVDDNSIIMSYHGEHLEVVSTNYSADDMLMTEEEWEKEKSERSTVLVIFP